MSLFRYFSITAVAGLVALLLLTGSSPKATDAAEPRLDVRYWFNGQDTCPDLIDTFQGQPEIYQGNCGGGDWAPSGTPPLLTLDDVYDQFLLAGDWNTDFCADVVAAKAGQMWLLEGDCAHDVKPAIQLPGDFSAYNYFVAPGLWDADSHPDLIARRADDSSLWLFSGDGNTGFTGDPVQIGTRWDACDLILGAGDFNNDGKVDLACRRADDHLLYLYPGDGAGGFDGAPQVIGNSAALSDADWILGGGDWLQGDALKCPDFAAWKRSDPTNITFFGGICADNAINTAQSLTVANQGGWHFPFGSDSARVFFWGDSDCSGQIVPRDGQGVLKFILLTPALSQTAPCFAIGSVVFTDGNAHLWGDWDCDGKIAPRDGQSALKFILGNPPLSSTEPCQAFGGPVGPIPD